MSLAVARGNSLGPNAPHVSGFFSLVAAAGSASVPDHLCCALVTRDMDALTCLGMRTTLAKGCSMLRRGGRGSGNHWLVLSSGRHQDVDCALLKGQAT